MLQYSFTLNNPLKWNKIYPNSNQSWKEKPYLRKEKNHLEHIWWSSKHFYYSISAKVIFHILRNWSKSKVNYISRENRKVIITSFLLLCFQHMNRFHLKITKSPFRDFFELNFNCQILIQNYLFLSGPKHCFQYINL